ncbi:MAG: O-antigen ligase family protein [Actinomycetota bacterium]|nr:O-antigen ligase family protein [Actinomycetota bacterium]
MSDRVGTRALWIAALPLLASPALLAFDSGGTGVSAQAVGAVVLFGLLAVCAVVAPWPLVERSWPLWALLALAGFGGWTAVSASWSPALGDAVNDADRMGHYFGAFFLAVVVMRAPGVRAVAPDVLLWGIVVVVLYALGGRLLPDVVQVELSSEAGDRLHQPLTYWNAMGILAGFGVLLATAVAADDRRGLAYRAAACAAGVPCGLACYLTLSRASWAAVAAGLAVLLLVRPRLSAALAAWLWASATVLLVVALRAFPGALHLDRGADAQASDGLPVALIAIGLAALTAFAFNLTMRRREAADAPEGGARRVLRGGLSERARERTPEEDTTRAALPPRRGTLAAGVIAATLAAGFAVSFASERTEEISKGAERVTTLKTYRGDYWRVGLESFADHPLAGVGTRGFQVEWLREHDERVFAYDAHSLYVETLAELGIVGFVLLAALVGTVAGGVRRRFRAVPGDPLLAACAAVLGAFAVHAGLDWDWEVPTVTLPALLLAAAAIQADT